MICKALAARMLPTAAVPSCHLEVYTIRGRDSVCTCGTIIRFGIAPNPCLDHDSHVDSQVDSHVDSHGDSHVTVFAIIIAK